MASLPPECTFISFSALEVLYWVKFRCPLPWCESGIAPSDLLCISTSVRGWELAHQQQLWRAWTWRLLPCTLVCKSKKLICFVQLFLIYTSLGTESVSLSWPNHGVTPVVLV